MRLHFFKKASRLSNVIKIVVASNLMLLSALLFAQEGELYISNFWPYNNNPNKVWSISQGHNDNMFFSTRKGVMSFDSEEWNLIPTSNLPYALEYDSITDKLYVGCLNLLGYLEKDEFGDYNFEQIYKPKEDIGVIYDIIVDGNTVYCFSNYAITKLSLTDTTDKKEWISTTNDNFLGAFLLGDILYVNIADAGLFKIENDTIWPTVNGYKLSGSEIVFSIPISENQVLLGTDNNELLIYKDNDFYPFKFSDQEYVNASVISGGILVNDSVFALSTLIGGCLLIDLETGKTIHTINYQTGLPDDEIISLGMDKDNGLWMSHSKGISRVDQTFPIRNYDAYPGLEGNILYLVTPNNELYVSTSEGVFYLKEVREFNEKIILKKSEKEEIEVISKKRNKGKKAFFSFFKPKDKQEQESEQKTGRNPGKKRFKIFGRSREKEKLIGDKDDSPPDYIKEKIYELRSISHRFEKISGINDKCKQMIVLPGRIIVAANNGLYEIVNHKARVIIEEAYFYSIAVDSTNSVVVAITPDNLYMLTLLRNKWIIEKHDAPDETVRSIYVTSKDSLWLGGFDLVYKVLRDSSEKDFYYQKFLLKNNTFEPVDVRRINDNQYFFQTSNQYKLQNDSILRTVNFPSSISGSNEYLISNSNYTWINNGNSWEAFPAIENFEKSLAFLNLFNNLKHIHVDDQRNLWLVTDDDNIYMVAPPDSFNYVFDKQKIFLTSLINGSGERINLDNLVVEYAENSIEFNLSSPFFLKQNSTQYLYYVEGLMKSWSRWSNDSKIRFPFIPAGEYALHVKAKNVLGVESVEQIIRFKIKTPFWQTKVFYLLVLLIIISLVFIVIKYRERGLRRESQLLSQMVKTRTVEIEKQKEEIETKNVEITSSIEYAKKIQSAVFPSKEKLDGILQDYFVFFKPRDIVSGDFYWATQVNDKVIIVAADCTGHGVPGAFMSMLGVSFLNEIVNKEENINAAEILNLLRNNVINTLSQAGKEEEARDGIDLALCVFDMKIKQMQFSGAYNPVLLIRNEQLYEYKANRMPVGIFTGPMKPFTNHIIDLMPKDKLYLFTDGYADQIGGPEVKKLMVRNFKKVILEIHKKPMKEQKEELNRIFAEWKGELPQIDDVLVMGIGF